MEQLRIAPFIVNYMKRLLREPLLHFLLIGAGLFVLFHYMRPHRDTSPTSRQIQFSIDELSQLALLYQSQWRREPTVDELDRLVENKVQQEVLYREALTMGLDKGDEIVKRRMAQKMQFLAEDVAAAHQPTDAELEAWFDENTKLFEEPERRRRRR